MAKRRPLSPTEIVVSVLFALAAFASLIGTLFGLFVPDANTGQLAPLQATLCLGPLAASLGSLAMIWLRNRLRPATGSLAAAVALWFVGVSLVGAGLFTAVTPGDTSFLANLGTSVALCMAPGGLLSLLGLGTFWHSQWRKRVRASQDEPQAVGDVEPALDENPYADIRQRASDYRRRITDLIQQNKHAAFASQFDPIHEKVARWEERVAELAGRLERFDSDQVLQTDIDSVPKVIENLQQQIAAETDPNVRAEMAATLAGYREQQAQLEQLVSVMRRTRLQLDKTLAAMGTIYSQVQLVGALEVDSARATHISDDIQDQADRLDDLLAAMRDLYSGPDAAGLPAGEDEERQRKAGKNLAAGA